MLELGIWRFSWTWSFFLRHLGSPPLEANSIQSVQRGNQFLTTALAHETNLDPVAATQVFAIATEKVAGLLHQLAYFRGVQVLRQRDGHDRGRHERAVTDDLEAQLAEPGSEPGRMPSQFGKAGVPRNPLNGCVKGVQQVRGKREGNALLLRVMAEVQITRQLASTVANIVMVEHHRDSRIRAQALAAGTGGQIDPGQVHRHGPDRADAVQAKLHLELAAKLLKPFEIGDNSRGSFAMNAPKPARPRVTLQGLPHGAQINGIAPGKLDRIELESEPPALIQEAIAEFAVSQH